MSPDKSFEFSLRKYNNVSANKIFNNFTKTKGNYFDRKYQYGGESVLEKKSNRLMTNSHSESKDSIYKNTQQSASGNKL